MKFYIERASGKPVEGVVTEPASYPFKASPSDQTVYTQEAVTVEISTLEELLELVNSQCGAILISWQKAYPPKAPRQHIPDLKIADDYL